MTGSARRGPSPVLVIGIVLIIALVAGGIAIWVLRPPFIMDKLSFEQPAAEVVANEPEQAGKSEESAPATPEEEGVTLPEAVSTETEAANAAPAENGEAQDPVQEVSEPVPVAPETAPVESVPVVTPSVESPSASTEMPPAVEPSALVETQPVNPDTPTPDVSPGKPLDTPIVWGERT